MGEASFFLDEHIPPAVAHALRSHGIEAISTAEAGRLGSGDTDHLAWARDNGRVVVTHDTDFLRLARHNEHAGIVYAAPGRHSVGSLVRALQRLATQQDAEWFRNRVVFV